MLRNSRPIASVLIVCVLLIVGCSLGEPVEAIDIQIDGESLDAMPEEGGAVLDASSDPMAGRVAPTLTGTDYNGVEVTIAPDGRPKAIYFIAHWCSHCQEEVPIVQSMIDQGAQPDGMDIYAVSTAVDKNRGNYPVVSWLDKEGFSVPVLRDGNDNQALKSYGSSGFPYVVYLDDEHRVVARSRGGLSAEAIEQLWALTLA